MTVGAQQRGALAAAFDSGRRRLRDSDDLAVVIEVVAEVFQS